MGDFSQRFSRPDAGSYTVEGNVSGSRAAMLEKKRQAEHESFEFEKNKRQRATMQSTLDIDSKFQPARIGSVEEQVFKAKTVGLVSAKDFIEASKQSYKLCRKEFRQDIPREQRNRKR